MDTLILDGTTWDLTLDASGNVAVGSAPYALAQDAASAIRLQRGELWYDTSQGMTWLQEILGKRPPASILIARLKAQALLVPGIASAQVLVSSIQGRQLTGQVQVTSTAGDTVAVAL